ncbi:MAG: BlaI/MecI/CopY family transcriptional regulator [Eubacteriales bacterium]|nr:BlaI/MecI/CopY family transcriptional regulator [Eubacteriales bacterium]
MRRLPDAELELMMLIWDSEGPVSRMEIEERMGGKRDVTPSTTLTLLSRLEERGFVSKTKNGKINYYEALVQKEPYLKETGRNILQKMFGGSLSNFAAALYMGEELSEEDVAQLQRFIDEKTGKKSE